jgi:hypothetical protein
MVVLEAVGKPLAPHGRRPLVAVPTAVLMAALDKVAGGGVGR